MATLIIYYSNGGTTELVAKTLAKNLRANMVRIHDLKNRDGVKNRIFASITLAPRILTFSSSLSMFVSPRLLSIVANSITSFPVKFNLSMIVKIAGVGFPAQVGVPKMIVSNWLISTFAGTMSVLTSLNAFIEANILL